MTNEDKNEKYDTPIVIKETSLLRKNGIVCAIQAVLDIKHKTQYVSVNYSIQSKTGLWPWENDK